MTKNQTIGLLIAIIALSLGLFWEKSFKYADVLDFIFELISALGISVVLKFLPLKRNKK
jgi:hypothetical protein